MSHLRIFSFVALALGLSYETVPTYGQSPPDDSGADFGLWTGLGNGEELGDPQVEEIEPAPASIAIEGGPELGPKTGTEEIDDTTTIDKSAPKMAAHAPIALLEEVVPLVEKVWEIYKDGLTVVGFESEFASALPPDTTMNSMQGWKFGQSPTYKVSFPARLSSAEALKFVFSIHYTYGGGIKRAGKTVGQYLTNVRVVEREFESAGKAWGYSFNASTKVRQPVNLNRGKGEPLAALELHLHYEMKRNFPLYMKRVTLVYVIKGDGTFEPKAQ